MISIIADKALYTYINITIHQTLHSTHRVLLGYIDVADAAAAKCLLVLQVLTARSTASSTCIAFTYDGKNVLRSYISHAHLPEN